eukprot:m.24287 g.24287  ORF g.24287 m.24287 type:complete len:90 (+) comp8582_c0_seq1:1367-1636(+)
MASKKDSMSAFDQLSQLRFVRLVVGSSSCAASWLWSMATSPSIVSSWDMVPKWSHTTNQHKATRASIYFFLLLFFALLAYFNLAVEVKS